MDPIAATLVDQWLSVKSLADQPLVMRSRVALNVKSIVDPSLNVTTLFDQSLLVKYLIEQLGSRRRLAVKCPEAQVGVTAPQRSQSLTDRPGTTHTEVKREAGASGLGVPWSGACAGSLPSGALELGRSRPSTVGGGS